MELNIKNNKFFGYDYSPFHNEKAYKIELALAADILNIKYIRPVGTSLYNNFVFDKKPKKPEDWL